MFFLFFSSAAQAEKAPSPALMGALGLNIVPSARMEETGTVRVDFSTMDPYVHAMAGMQIAAPLHIGIRQSALSSSVNGSADRLYPGVDLRLRLWPESAHVPAAVLGLQSAIGHRRMAGEYLAFSKRYNSFDFTGGLAWRRLGSAAHMSNPLGVLGSHFTKRRALDALSPNAPEDWFTGESIGFFGGVEYFPAALEGISFKADWGADRYSAEKAADGYNAPSPWSLGVDYAPFPWANIGAALVGGEKLMARLSLRAPLEKWEASPYKNEKPSPMRPYRTGLALSGEIEAAAARDNIRLYETRTNARDVSAKLLLDPNRSLPLQYGRAVIPISNHTGETIETIRMTPLSYGLEGSEISLQRRDFEQALIRHQGSPQEIWRNVSFEPADEGKDIFHDRFNAFDAHGFRLILDNRLSLSEEDSGLLYRESLVFEESRKLSEHIWAGGGVRFDLADNLARLNEFRPRAFLPVRSDEDVFARHVLSLDRSYLGWMTTLKPDLHMGLSAGLLEEMYAGAGGEILYRPFGKTFAIGAEGWQVFKRDPYTVFDLGLTGDHLLSGHVQAWYEFPESDITLHARAGRYLAEDVGATLALSRGFENGAKIEAFVTATDKADFNLFGGTTHLYSGLKFSLPLGSLKYIPEGSHIRTIFAPQGRDAGQALEPPLRLYDVSEPLSYRHITQNWGRITP